MRDDTESDFCDRLPGQHTGRLSLELQAREAAEWQRKVTQLEFDIGLLQVRILELEAMLEKLKSSPAAVESTAVEKASVNGRSLPPCPKCGGEPMLRSETRGGLKSDRHWMQCSRCQRRTVVRNSVIKVIRDWKGNDVWNSPAAGESAPISPEVPQAHGLTPPATPSAAVGASEPGAGDTVSRAEYDRVVKLMNHFRDVIAEYHDMALADSKPEPSPPAESSAPVVSTADRLRSFSEQLESGETIKATRIERHDTPDGPMHVRTQTDMKPAESPDDWVMINEPDHVVRSCDRLSSDSENWRGPIDSLGKRVKDYPALKFRCRRKDLPVPADKPRMRQVTLREYRQGQVSDWTSSGVVSWSLFTGRTAVVEVPE